MFAGKSYKGLRAYNEERGGMMIGLRLVVGVLFLSCLVFVGDGYGQQRGTGQGRAVDYADLPRVTALEAFRAYKSGKMFALIHSGGESYRKRHIMGAVDLPLSEVTSGKKRIPRLPKSKGMIFIYCY